MSGTAIALLMIITKITPPDGGWQPVADPMAPGLSGQISCNKPDTVKKTCEGFTIFQRNEDGSVIIISEDAMSNHPAITATTKTRIRAEAKDGALCWTAKAEDFEYLEFTPAKGLADNATLVRQLAEMRQQMFDYASSNLAGYEFCGHHFVKDNRYRSLATKNGIAVPEFDNEYIWLDDTTGYTLFTTEPVPIAQ